MTIALAAAPTALDRLRQAISRMISRHGFQLVPTSEAAGFSPAGPAILLLTEDPLRNLEVLDACVILPEALRARPGEVTSWVADPEASQILMARFSVARAPAAVFLRDGRYVGSVSGIRDWAEYQAELSRLLDGSVQPRPTVIPILTANAEGACP